MMEFEWDEDKEQENIRKHEGVTFRAAAMIFKDNNRIERFDTAHSDFEDRYQTIGIADGLLFVVYTEREDKTRIISARHAEPFEEDTYYGYSENDIDGWRRIN